MAVSVAKFVMIVKCTSFERYSDFRFGYLIPLICNKNEVKYNYKLMNNNKNNKNRQKISVISHEIIWISFRNWCPSSSLLLNIVWHKSEDCLATIFF